MSRSRRAGARAPMTGPALVLALALLVSGCRLGGDAADPATPDASASPSTEQEPTGPARYQPTDEDYAALVATLGVRARAVRTDDLTLFLSIVDPRDRSFVEEQRTLFANLTALPLTRYFLDAEADYVPPAEVQGAEVALSPMVVEHVQVTGVDVRPAGYDVHLTWVKRGERWLLGAEESSTYQTLNAAGTSRPWFGRAIAVRSDGPTVVLTDASRADQADVLLETVRSGIDQDAGTLGLSPRYDVLVDATSNGSADKMNTLDDDEAAAVSYSAYTLDVAGDDPSKRAGSRVKVNPKMVGEIIDDDIVLRHELTHFLTLQEHPPVPRWVSEGLAEYVAHAPSTPADYFYPAAAYDRIQAAADQGVPTSGVFGSSPLEDYVASWCAVTFLVQRSGMAEFRAFMDDFERSYEVYGDGQVRALLRRHYDLGPREFTDGTGAVMRQIHSL